MRLPTQPRGLCRSQSLAHCALSRPRGPHRYWMERLEFDLRFATFLGVGELSAQRSREVAASGTVQAGPASAHNSHGPTPRSRCGERTDHCKSDADRRPASHPFVARTSTTRFGWFNGTIKRDMAAKMNAETTSSDLSRPMGCSEAMSPRAEDPSMRRHTPPVRRTCQR